MLPKKARKWQKFFSFPSLQPHGLGLWGKLELGCATIRHSYVLVVHTLRVAENEILKLDLPAKRH
jgi:hypothetical protein